MDIPNKQSIGSDKTRDFLEKLIDEYKYGELSAEDICRKADDFFASHTVYCGRDEDLRRVVDEILPETLKTYKETPSDDDQRMLNFWKGLKDCDHLLYFGRTYTEEIEEYLETGMERADAAIMTAAATEIRFVFICIGCILLFVLFYCFGILIWDN